MLPVRPDVPPPNGGTPTSPKPAPTQAAPTQRDTSLSDGRFTGRLRSLLAWSTPSDDPVLDLLRMHRQIHTHADVNVLRRSYTIAERMHRGQMRKSGEPYI